jgi:hypothetical protein
MAEQYPKWLYHRTETPVVVYDPDEHAAKGDGWEESPAFLNSDDESEEADESESSEPEKKVRRSRKPKPTEPENASR